MPFMVHQAGVSTQAPGTCPEPLRRGLRAKTIAAATVMIMSNQCYYSRCRTLTIHRVCARNRAKSWSGGAFPLTVSSTPQGVIASDFNRGNLRVAS